MSGRVGVNVKFNGKTDSCFNFGGRGLTVFKALGCVNMKRLV